MPSTPSRRLHPSAPRSPPGSRPAPLCLENGSQTGQTHMLRRPSTYWFKSPAWIDGASNPPIYFYCNEQILDTLAEFQPDHPMLLEARARAAAASLTPVVPSTTFSSTPASSTAALSSISVPSNAASLSATAPLPTAASTLTESLGGIAATGLDLTQASGYMVSITMLSFAPTEPGKGSRTSKSIAKKQRHAKFDNINVLDLDRKAFICEWLRVHDLVDQYSPGVHSGPPFKLWWTGSAGGKGGAVTIDSDRDYEVAVNAISKKNKNSCQIGVEFDTTEGMDGFRIRKRPLPQHEDKDDEVELMYGTKVPRVDGYNESEQLHGAIILQLKQKWTCEKHLGEHGESGVCYIDSTGSHLGLNNRKLKIWASAIAAADSTKHEPPNTIEFDGIRDGRTSSSVKPRGRGGPRRASSPLSSSDSSTMLLTLLTGLASGSASAAAASASAFTANNQPVTPVRGNASSTQVQSFSPMPTPSSELHTCLADFARLKKIDLTSSESALMALDLTPDIIPHVPISRLSDIISAVEGQIYKFQAFCQGWTERLEEKKRRLL